ncbi:MAG: hypothetical protein V1783_01145 [Bacteroidota bacterium]
MNFIKKYFQENRLRKAYSLNKRLKEFNNFSLIKTIGIISNPQTEEQMNQFLKIVNHFHVLGKQSFSLLFLDKLIKDEHFLTNIDGHVISEKNCNWIGTPTKDINLNHFINKDFDLLIDLSFTPSYSLNYLFILSNARLKAMPTSDFSRKYADLMLDSIKTDNKFNFTTELIHYLEIINKNQK